MLFQPLGVSTLPILIPFGVRTKTIPLRVRTKINLLRFTSIHYGKLAILLPHGDSTMPISLILFR